MYLLDISSGLCGVRQDGESRPLQAANGVPCDGLQLFNLGRGGAEKMSTVVRPTID